MMVFITSVRHPRNSHSYGRILSLLKASLESVCAQTDRDFKVIVIANQRDEIGFSHPNLEWLTVDFPPPSQETGPRTGHAAVRRDKGCKYAVGLCRARELTPNHVMFFDADDFVHRGIAAFCNERKDANGWYVDRGHAWRSGSLIYGDVEHFYKWCGTCNIINFQLFDWPETLSTGSSIDDIERSLGKEFVHTILGAHPFTVGYFAERGLPLAPLPFPAAVYLRGTNENHSGLSYGLVVRSWPKIVNRRFCTEFGINVDLGLGRKVRTFILDWPLEVYRTFRYRKSVVQPPV